MNVILEKTDQVRYFTNMRLVLDALEISAVDFDWFISDIETNGSWDVFKQDDQWMSGVELNRILAAHDIQFIWAVFSAVPRGVRPFFKKAPYANDNSDYWSDREILPQMSGALFEIACWDSSATILIGLPEQAIERFIKKYSDTRPLRMT